MAGCGAANLGRRQLSDECQIGCTFTYDHFSDLNTLMRFAFSMGELEAENCECDQEVNIPQIFGQFI